VCSLRCAAVLLTAAAAAVDDAVDVDVCDSLLHCDQPG
jgi:hypothetical protein